MIKESPHIKIGSLIGYRGKLQLKAGLGLDIAKVQLKKVNGKINFRSRKKVKQFAQ